MLPWTGVCCYRSPCHSRMWLWTSAGRSGSNWTLLRGACTRMWHWRTTATCCQWVSTAALCVCQGPECGYFHSQLLGVLEHLKCVMVSSWICPRFFRPFSALSLLLCSQWNVITFLKSKWKCHWKSPEIQSAGPNPVPCPVNRVPGSQTRGHLQVGARRRAVDVGGGNPTSELFRWVSVTHANGGHGSKSHFF